MLGMSAIFAFAFSQLQYHFRWGSIWIYREKFLHGWELTIVLSLFSLVCSFIIGLAFAVAQKSHILFLRYFSKLYVEVVRGTPLLVQILIFFYVIADAFHLENRYVAGVLILSCFAAAYVTEIIRAGIESIGESQLETARSLGFSQYQTYRYIIFPQVIKRILPPLAGQFASLIKDSSLLSIISVSELTLNAQEVNSFTYSTLESYLPLAIGYIVLTFPISYLSKILEKRFNYAT